MKLKIPRAAAGVLVMLLAGFIYAWSVLSVPVSAEFPQWKNAQLSLIFTLCMAFFCLGGIAAGILSGKINVGFNLAISAVLFAAGFLISSRAYSLAAMYIGYGVFCGLASGFAYNSVLNVIPKWFPENQGLISGILLMGFGASSMITGTLFTAFSKNGNWRNTLLVFGIIISAAIALSIILIKPPPGENVKAKNSIDSQTELSAPQMLKRKSFWLIYVWLIIVSAVGLVIISQSRLIAGASAPGMSASALSFAVGLISVCNGLGRVLFGQLFDKAGHRKTMMLIGIILFAGVALVALSVYFSSMALLIAGFVLSGTGYGGGPTMSAALIRKFYGGKNYPVNFSITNSQLLIASFSSAGAGFIYDKTAGFTVIFIILIAAIIVAAAIGAMVKKA